MCGDVLVTRTDAEEIDRGQQILLCVKIGNRRMFLIGVIVFGVGSLAAAFSPSAWVLIAARGLLGVGAETMMPASLALVRMTFTKVRERNLAIAVWMSVAVVGAAA